MCVCVCGGGGGGGYYTKDLKRAERHGKQEVRKLRPHKRDKSLSEEISGFCGCSDSNELSCMAQCIRSLRPTYDFQLYKS